MKHIRVVLERDSVCAADDFDGRHAKTIGLDPGITVRDAIEKLRTLYPLPLISGGRATWVICTQLKPVALVAQELNEEKYFVDPCSPLLDHMGESDPRIHFRYFAQRSPDEVFARVRKGWRGDRPVLE